MIGSNDNVCGGMCQMSRLAVIPFECYCPHRHTIRRTDCASWSTKMVSKNANPSIYCGTPRKWRDPKSRRTRFEWSNTESGRDMWDSLGGDVPLPYQRGLGERCKLPTRVRADRRPGDILI